MNPTEVLTKQQVAILALIANDFSRKEIAGLLSIAPKTVDKHYLAIKERLAVKGTAGMTKIAVAHHLVSPN